MTPASQPHIERDAPAKLNLGLEVIGRRDDGFHEIATVFIAVDIYDRLKLTPRQNLELVCADPLLAGQDNLALRALHALREAASFGGGVRIDLDKHIPAAAGLGGASSDAAAALLAARGLWRLEVSDDELHAVAARIGSDVPFFLHGGCAAGRGRGDLLAPLPLPGETWFVVVAPRVTIPSKTATLYARLGREDFSDGSRVAAQAARLASGLPPAKTLLGNAFASPLYAICPEVADLPGIMRAAGAPSVAISGAGPAHYTLVNEPDRADAIAACLRERLGDRVQLFIARPVPAWSAPRRPL